jgi:methylase of polypeptide subunit release factors
VPAALPHQIGLLRDDLDAVGFRVDTLRELWGGEADGALSRGQRVPALRVLDKLTTSPLGTVATLFVLGEPVPTADLDRALPGLRFTGAETLGLVEVDGGVVRPLVDLRPYSFVDSAGEANWWIASDLGEIAIGGALREDHVLGVGGASVTLSGLIIETRVGTALDLGTGCGIQAMHVARHADTVIATDISERALDFARFNAQLNSIDGIEFRLGSLFEPVVGERFDQIVSNPPFVITPRVDGVPAYEYRDGGMVGDQLVANVVREVGAHLTPGGVAQFLGNWEYRADESGLNDRTRDWLEGTGLDAWVIEREVQDPTEYAETWIRDGGTRAGSADYDRLYGAWLDDFEGRGVTAVGMGYLVLRRPIGHEPTMSRFESIGTSGAIAATLGGHLEACIAAHDWQVSLDDGTLAAAVLTVAPDVTEERHHWPGSPDPTVIVLHQGGGFGRSISVDTGLAALVGACDGELGVGAICAAIAQLLEADEPALRAELLGKSRELLDTGFLVPPTYD